jgi:hypothetical protein
MAEAIKDDVLIKVLTHIHITVAGRQTHRKDNTQRQTVG